MKKSALEGVGVAVALVALVAMMKQVLPDLRRYLRMRSM
ncbi:DUF6893 family small protein [Streptomyces venezuelae]